MAHALVIGGTGMLRGTAVELTRRFETVSVVGQSAGRLKSLQESDSKINPIKADYVDSDAFLGSIDLAAKEHGEIGLTVVWVHDTAPDAPLLLARQLNQQQAPVDYFHVLGSAYARPDAGAAELREEFSSLTRVTYHQVILGFIVTGNSSRWLSNQEISSGVTQAIRSKLPLATVGTTEPWSMRP